MASRILVSLGPFSFSSGYTPQGIEGPSRESYIVEHAVPGREGGITEYVGSRRAGYQIRGFLAPNNDTIGGPAASVLSGTVYTAVDSDASKDFLIPLKASGAQLFKVESIALVSGVRYMYENDFFYIENLTFGYEAGRGYPYYPYSMTLRGASTKTFGQSSGTASMPTSIAGSGLGSYLSGYAMTMTWRSGFYQGGLVVALGFNCLSIASGSARMAVFNTSGPQGTSQGLVMQTASQPVHSGWNYFPVRPILLAMNSGNFYQIGVMTDVVSNSGFTIALLDAAGGSGTTSFQSGIIYSSGFPDPFAPSSGLRISGIQLDVVLVSV